MKKLNNTLSKIPLDCKAKVIMFLLCFMILTVTTWQLHSNISRYYKTLEANLLPTLYNYLAFLYQREPNGFFCHSPRTS